MEKILVYAPFALPGNSVKARSYPSFFKRSFIFHKFFKGKEEVFTDLWNTVSPAFILLYSRQPEMESGH